MKKLLLIIGILSIVVCVIALLLALLNMQGYNNLLDGTAEHYERLHNRMIVCFVSGAVFAVIGAACFVIRSKM